MKTPEQHEYENKVKRDIDRLYESKADQILISLFIVIILSIVYSIIY